MFKYKLEFG